RATLVKMTRWPARLLSGAITKLFFEVSTSSSGPARLKYAVSEPFISEMMRMLSSGPYSPIRPSQRGGAGAGLGDCASEADCQYEAARVDCLLAKGLIAAPQANKPTASFNNIEGYFSSRIFMIGYAYAKLDHGGPRESPPRRSPCVRLQSPDRRKSFAITPTYVLRWMTATMQKRIHLKRVQDFQNLIDEFIA